MSSQTTVTDAPVVYDVQAHGWWIATGPKRLNGKRKMGPFITRELALDVRVYVEEVERRSDLWLVSGEDVPDA